MTWTALPQGQAIPVAPGSVYAITASLKSSHSAADISSLAASHWGLTVTVYAEQGDPAYPSLPTSTVQGYKNVYGVAQATHAATVPWGVSSVGGIFGGLISAVASDSSTILQAWSSTDPSDVANPPTAWGQLASGTTPVTPPGPSAIAVPQGPDYSWVPPAIPWILGGGALVSFWIGAWSARRTPDMR